MGQIQRLRFRCVQQGSLMVVVIQIFVVGANSRVAEAAAVVVVVTVVVVVVRINETMLEVHGSQADRQLFRQRYVIPPEINSSISLAH